MSKPRIGRTLPPAAAPLTLPDLINGIIGILQPQKAIDHFKQSLLKKFKVKHVFLLSSGKAALTVSLKAIAQTFPDKREVIVPAFNCYSVPSAIVKAGLTVVPCEVDLDTLQLNKEHLLQLLENSNSILTIIPTHLFGLPADLENLKKMLQKAGHTIPIIEDAAQAMGSSYNGKYLGTNGDIGIFSLGRGKALSAGEGGIIITNSDSLANTISTICSTIPTYSSLQIFKLLLQTLILSMMIHPNLFWIPKMLPFLKLGETLFDTNFPIQLLSGFQAGLAKNWNTKLMHQAQLRAANIQLLSMHLTGNNALSLFTTNYVESSLSCIRYPILFANKEMRDMVLMKSEKMGFGITPTYPDAISNIPQIGIQKDKCPNAELLAMQLLTLPCHPLVTNRDILKIFNLLNTVFKTEATE